MNSKTLHQTNTRSMEVIVNENINLETRTVKAENMKTGPINTGNVILDLLYFLEDVNVNKKLVSISSAS